jgi:transitional endoplasmic reticulum ATPase
MDVDVSDDGDLGRVAAVSADGMRAWIALASGRTVSVTSRFDPLELVRGGTVFVTAYGLEPVPDEAFPSGEGTAPSTELWVGVVALRTDDVTLVDLGVGPVRQVPTTDVTYEIGNTVEGTDAAGVSRVLSPKPLPRFDQRQLDDDDVSEFRHEPTGDVSFADFGGLPEVVERAKELIELPLARHEELLAIGAKPVKGILFTGLPGTGKTMLARIIANVAEATFYEISGPSVISKWVGQSEQVLRDIFNDAAHRAPSIIFFDEIDSVAGRRTEEAHEASKRVVAQLLTLMDGFLPEHRVTVIAATNRPQDIDVALRRPGRFDWEIEFPMPLRDDREAILRASGAGLVCDEPLPFRFLAAQTEGWSAADLAAIWREAALLAVGDHARRVIMTEDVLGAHERVAAQRRRIYMQAPSADANTRELDA